MVKKDILTISNKKINKLPHNNVLSKPLIPMIMEYVLLAESVSFLTSLHLPVLPALRIQYLMNQSMNARKLKRALRMRVTALKTNHTGMDNLA